MATGPVELLSSTDMSYLFVDAKGTVFKYHVNPSTAFGDRFIANADPHDHIWPIHSVDTIDDHVVTRMALHPGVDLYDAYMAMERAVWHDMKGFVTQVASALAHIQRSGAIVSDTKMENVMYADGRYHLIDFGGLIATSDKMSPMKSMTLSYMPPETVATNKVGHGADAWCFGVMVFRGVNKRHHVENAIVPARVDDLAVKHRASIEARVSTLPILRAKLAAVEATIETVRDAGSVAVKIMSDLRRRQRNLTRTIARIESGALMSRFNSMVNKFEIAESVQRKALIMSRTAARPRRFLPSDVDKGRQRTAAPARHRGAGAGALVPSNNTSAPPVDMPGRATVVDEMRAAMEGEAMPVQVVSLHDKCPNGHGPLVESLNMQHLICRHPGCGHTQVMYKMTVDIVSFNQTVGMSSSSYSRKGHLMDRLATFMCKNRKKLNPQLRDQVCEYIFRAAMKARVPVYEMGFTVVHTIMRRLQMTTLDKNIYSFEEWFACLMTNTPPHRPSKLVIERVKLMHRACETPYDKKKNNGANYFGCNYFLNKAFRMLGYVEYLEHFPLQSCDSTLRDTDNMYLPISSMFKWALLGSFKYDPAADFKRLRAMADQKRDSHNGKT